MKPLLLAIVFSLGLPMCVVAQLQPNDRVAITGDSITEQKIYSVYIEDYLLACRPAMNLTSIQFGWSGESSWGFLRRLDSDCLAFKPGVATTCYGMNDGAYAPISAAVSDHYRRSMEGLVDAFTKAGTRVVVGGPGCVDTAAFHRDSVSAEEYNKTLAALNDIAKETAAKHNLPFANVYQSMHDVMEKAKSRYGNNYTIAGNDGVHPGANGHLVMAYAFLKAFGCTGDIGTIAVDMRGGKAVASDGHKVASFEGDTLMIESSKYPFCFPAGDQKRAEHLEDPNNARGVLEFFPFNADLNRFMLVVNNPTSQNVKISWGNDSKTFSADQLAKGINLADEFLDNPLTSQFAKIDAAVRAQQNFETPMVKNLIHSMAEQLPDEPGLMSTLLAALMKKDAALQKAASDAVVPVTHMIRVQAVQ